MSNTNSLDYLILHCTATPKGRDVQAQEVQAWHEQRWGKGKIGYRCLVLLDGTIHRFKPANLNAIVEPDEITFGVKGLNKNSHHVCYVGGCEATPRWTKIKGVYQPVYYPENTLTPEQDEALASIAKFYIKEINPRILIAGHNQFDTKGCPSFDVRAWCRKHGIAQSNIYQVAPKVKLAA